MDETFGERGFLFPQIDDYPEGGPGEEGGGQEMPRFPMIRFLTPPASAALSLFIYPAEDRQEELPRQSEMAERCLCRP